MFFSSWAIVGQTLVNSVSRGHDREIPKVCGFSGVWANVIAGVVNERSSIFHYLAILSSKIFTKHYNSIVPIIRFVKNI